jgi:hypothetical protein
MAVFRGQIIIFTLFLLSTTFAEGAQFLELKADGPKPKTDLYGDPLPPGDMARLGIARLRHGRGATIAFAADGKTLISFGGERTLRFWDEATGRQVRERAIPKSHAVAGRARAGLSGFRLPGNPFSLGH